MFVIYRIILTSISYHVASAFLFQVPNSKIKWRSPPTIGHRLLSHATTSGTMTNSSYILDGWYRSHISRINCFNLGGIVRAKDPHNHVGHTSHEADSTISLSLGSSPNFVVVTGESGSGKSMLISTTMSLILGGKKFTASLLPRPPYAKAEVILKLSEPHISIALNKFKEHGLDTALLSVNDDDKMATLTLMRDFSMTERSKQRIKSTCAVNGKLVPLRSLRSIASAFIAVIDASVASVALSSQQKRIKIIDIGVSNQYPDLIQSALETRNQYREDRRKRELIQKELELRILPKSLMSNDSSQQDLKLDLLKHFLGELDDFEYRIHSFRDKCKNAPYAEMYSSTSPSRKRKTQTMPTESLKHTYSSFVSSSWLDVSEEDAPLSVIYTNLIGMREALKKLDTQITAAQSACDIVSSLSSKNSMSSALESARKFIYEAGEQEALEDNVSKAFERSHELLNDMENVLQKCRRFFEDDTNGPVATLLSLRSSFDVSIEDIDLLITDWGILARKHGVSPYLLPSCHRSLRIELDGNIERSILLPQALEAEERSLKHYEVASRQLSNARAQVCHDLSKAVSQRLPSLGMEAIFVSRLNKGIRKCSDATTGILGVDSVDFLLVNKKQLKNYEVFSVLDTNDEQHSLLDVMGSSGEKARVLLCLEASIPGSVGSCIADQNPNDTETIQESVYGDSVQPLVSVLYDEIDAHVGGRALVSMGKMLLEQTLSSSSSSSGVPKKRGQVISITHSASLAALADHHLVVRKVKQDATQISDVIEVSVTCVEGNERTKELARMASGDIAVDEAEQFAKALLRDRFKVEEDSGLHL